VTGESFTQRIAAVRQRFVARLGGRIGEIEDHIPQLGRDGCLEMLAQTHRTAHDLCGVGPTMGFVATGQAARAVEQILLGALNANRALTPDEMTRASEGVARLRAAAQSESQAAG